MEEKCELLEKCGFFINFKGNSEVIKQGWVRMFCESKMKSERCKRKQVRRETGNPPLDNMAPTGDIIRVMTG
jgi:hypothetical protein